MSAWQKLTLENFIERSKASHPGQNLDYSKVIIVNTKTPVCIIDHDKKEDGTEYGEYWQTPDNHFKGKSHPLRGIDKRSLSRRTSVDDVLRRMEESHKGQGYDLSKVVYKGMNKEVTIIHPIYGEFQMTPHSFIKGCNYHKPNNTKGNCGHKSTTEEFIEKAKIIHNDRYDYSLVEYINAKENVTIICPIHGEFQQTPNNHLLGRGCEICANERISQNHLMDLGVWIEKCKANHTIQYDYSKVIYKGTTEKVEIICPKHGSFWQYAGAHYRGCNCPKCMNHYSKTEEELAKAVGLLYESHNRMILDGLEIDIYYPTKKIGIEYNGLRWHSEWYGGKDKNYHISKTEKCNEKGVKLIQIFEDEYMTHKELVIDKVKHLLGVNEDSEKEKIMARKCSIEVINRNLSEDFLNKFHIQGFVSSTVYLGCFDRERRLIGVMSFINEDKKSGKWNLNRFATNSAFICQGVGGKMFSYFVNKWQPNEVKSFADRRWTLSPEENLYTKIGFDYVGNTVPDYRYFNGKTLERFHKFNFRKATLSKKYNLDMSLTETEMVKELGYDRIWDCGLFKYIWKKR